MKTSIPKPKPVSETTKHKIVENIAIIGVSTILVFLLFALIIGSPKTLKNINDKLTNIQVSLDEQRLDQRHIESRLTGVSNRLDKIESKVSKTNTEVVKIRKVLYRKRK